MSSFEYCIHCDQATDHAGMADDSNFAYDMSGPYCDNCFSLYEKGRDAGMERAAVIASNVKAPFSRFTIAAKIRNEIEND